MDNTDTPLTIEQGHTSRISMPNMNEYPPTTSDAPSLEMEAYDKIHLTLPINHCVLSYQKNCGTNGDMTAYCSTYICTQNNNIWPVKTPISHKLSVESLLYLWCNGEHNNVTKDLFKSVPLFSFLSLEHINVTKDSKATRHNSYI